MDRNSLLNNLFSYTKSEQRGIIVLLVLILGVLLYRYLFFTHEQNIELQITYLEESTQSDIIQEKSLDNKKNQAEKEKYALPKAPINLNNIDKQELLAIGFSEFAANNLVKFRNKGGLFYSLSDLERIYGIDTSLLRDLEPFLVFNQKPTESSPGESGLDKKLKSIEINSADTFALKKLPGIGNVLSQRIIKYRELLGGFHRKEQLVEVYGISDSLVNFLDSQIELDTNSIRKIDLNRASLEELQNHPYITRYQAKAILSYREMVGKIDSYKILTDNYLIPDEVYSKIKPYLSLN